MVWKGSGGDFLVPCLVVLIDEIDARAPGRDKQSDGSIGDRAHQARPSDHNPDANGAVRALDVTDDEGNLHADLIYDSDDFDIDVFFEWLRLRKDPRIKYVISDNRMFSSYWSGGIPPYTWRTYSGTNPHERHGHISTLPEHDNNTTTWFPEEGLMSDEFDAIMAKLHEIEHEATVRQERIIDLLENDIAHDDRLVERETATEGLRNIKRIGHKLGIGTIEGGNPDGEG